MLAVLVKVLTSVVDVAHCSGPTMFLNISYSESARFTPLVKK